MPLLVAKVHSVAKAPLPPFASGAFLRAELGMVAVSAETVLPYVDEIIRVDVALVVVGAYAVAAGDGPVYAYRGWERMLLQPEMAPSMRTEAILRPAWQLNRWSRTLPS